MHKLNNPDKNPPCPELWDDPGGGTFLNSPELKGMGEICLCEPSVDKNQQGERKETTGRVPLFDKGNEGDLCPQNE